MIKFIHSKGLRAGIAIKPKTRLIEYYDSLRGTGDEYLQAAHDWVRLVLKEHYVEDGWYIANEYQIDVDHVPLTTGMYMLGMGIGSVFVAPTALLYGKRPVYLGGAALLVVTCAWCALSPTFESLVLARVF